MGFHYGWLLPVLHPPHALGGRRINGYGSSLLHRDGGTSHPGWCPTSPIPPQELVKLEWDIFPQLLEETISKLESAEPDILLRK